MRLLEYPTSYLQPEVYRIYQTNGIWLRGSPPSKTDKIERSIGLFKIAIENQEDGQSLYPKCYRLFLYYARRFVLPVRELKTNSKKCTPNTDKFI